MTSKYSKLSDEILAKKISSMLLQVKGILSFLKEKNVELSELENISCDENDYLTSERTVLEQNCDKITDAVTALKNKQQIAMKKEKEVPQKTQTQNQTEDDGEENQYVDVKPKYDVITSLETIKRAFFNPSNEEYVSFPFSKQIVEHPFVYYKGTYKYSDDMNNKAEYIARNFNKSFVKRMEEYGKYVFAMFTCSKIEKDENVKYTYESYMLLNSTGAFEDFIMKDNDDILFEKMDVNAFLENFKKNEADFDTLFVH